MGDVFRKLALQKESRIDQGDVMLDYVHIHDGLDPTEIRDFAGGRFIKGKSAIDLARTYRERKHNFTGLSFWARGFFVSTVGRDEEVIREYIKNQEQEDKRLDQLNLWR